MRNGLSLIEISIVFVAIGIITAGVLIAQGIIETSKVNGFVKKMQQIDLAVTNFRDSYRCLPGDSNVFSVPGNCDNVLDGTPDFVDEVANFWVHLNAGDFFPEGETTNYTATVTGQVEPGINIPSTDFSPDLGILATSDTSESPHKLTYMITAFEEGSDTSIDGGLSYDPGTAIDLHIALAIDTKIDDGLPRTGIVRALMWDTPNQAWLIAGVMNDCAPNGQNVYDIDNATDCQMVIEMLSLY